MQSKWGWPVTSGKFVFTAAIFDVDSPKYLISHLSSLPTYLQAFKIMLSVIR